MMLKGTNQWMLTVRRVVLIASMVALVVAAAQPAGAEPIESINFQNADVRSVLNFLAEYGGVNIVAAPAVQGQVTLNLKNVDWRQALSILAKTYSLKVVEEEGYFRVMLLADYLKEVQELERFEADKRQLVDLRTQLIEIKYANAKDLVKPVKSLLTSRGKVDVDNRTNTLLITDEPGTVGRISEYVAELDKETRQIKISARLLEVSSEYLEEIGIDWSVVTSGTDSRNRIYTNEATTDHGNRVTDPSSIYKFSTLQKDWRLDATLQAIVNSGNGKILAQPEVTTVENKEARIQMGQKVPIKQFSASGDVVISFEEVGTILRVTPHITSSDRILLHLQPERSSFSFEAAGVVINTNNANTNVVVADGQTAVIGGLTTEDEIITRVGVPVLMDIPVLGRLFSYDKKDVRTRDLVVFVTPEIVDNALMGAVEPEELPTQP
ncbi:MAG: type IV pilus secretin PilQ [candidate division Zixibacteria bacterium]|nr:type IV pilus secretin PilQ [candidate division Zixibacteria bacterium]